MSDEAITETPPDTLAAIDALLDPAAKPAPEPDPGDELRRKSDDVEGDEPSRKSDEVEGDDEAAKEAHKEEMRELYAREVTLQDGEKTTIGALKDAYQTRQQAQVELLERENKILANNRELNELAQALNVVPEHMRHAAVQQREQFVATEFQNLLTAIPEWKEASAFDSGRKAVFALAAEYGLEQDMSAVVDHRVVKLLHDYARLKHNIKHAKESLVPKAETSVPAGRKPVTAPATSRPKGMNAQLSAIDALIA